MRLNPAAFDNFLGGNIGQDLLWRRRYSCACTNPSSGAPDPRHALCGGKGHLWDPSVPTRAGVANQQTLPELQAAGLWESGDMVLSIPQSAGGFYDNCSMFDRVIMMNSDDVFSQPLTRGGAGERLIFSVRSIDRCFWLHPTTRLVVEGGVPVVDANGGLTWPNGGEPPPGTIYSLTGTKFNEYFVFMRFPSDRGEHFGARLPKKVVLRKFDLLNR
jgi:hypothetical protein